MRKHRMIIVGIVCSLAAALVLLAIASPAHAQQCQQTVTANVVALDQPFMWNRLGTAQPQGMIFALERDIVPVDNPVDQYGNDINVNIDPSKLQAGQVRLRSDKRARPIVSRVNVGSCLEINFRNLLSPTTPTYLPPGFAVHTRQASIHLSGLDLVKTINSDGSWVGTNESSLVTPGDSLTYLYSAAAEGTFLLYSTGDEEQQPFRGQYKQMVNGLFGAVNVQPEGAEYYRSQATRQDMHLATYRADALPNNMRLTPKLGPDSRNIRTRLRKSLFSQEVPDAALTQDVWVLTTVNERSQTVHTVDVVKSPDGHLYALDTGTDPETGQHSGHPLINYGALYPANDPRGRGCTPILKMAASKYAATTDGRCQRVSDSAIQLYHTDLTAIITGPDAGRFPYTTVSPTFNENPALPDRRQPYREFTIHYHNASPVQPFEQFFSPSLRNTLGAGQDQFAINYGIAGIGAEILANRLKVGPMGINDDAGDSTKGDAVELKFEEFFLASWAVGDPAMVVDVPANAQNQVISGPPGKYSPAQGKVNTDLLQKELNIPTEGWTPLTRTRATKAYYPDDPSNVYRSYMRDHVKFRILHAGPGATHVHHLHAHQWLRSPNSDDGHYLDSQMLIPGASYTLEIAYGGSGNRNLTVGDSIFHCHFYPHFAGGMWSLWRVHDVFEAGTELDDAGIPKRGVNRALPDGEITNGTPIPAVVPLPTLAMAPLPADVMLADVNPGDGRRVHVVPDSNNPDGTPVYSNPGFPFFVPGIAGHRTPHPPMDFASMVDESGGKVELNGGLPRHVVFGGTIFRQFMTRWDFSKDFVRYDRNNQLVDGYLKAYQLPEEGTAVEKAAMAAHATRTHKTYEPNGDPGNFILNGLPPVSGAPFANPGVTDDGNSNINTRRYKAANIQIDAVFNKKGWHYPQQRIITLWDDVQDTVQGKRPPQPFFFRGATGETIEFWHTNLVPNYYELDDFQVRTPTDIIGQHIHLVKFDVLASDGSSNGFNYEDGTFSPDEVRERIFAINKAGGLYAFDDGAQQFYNPQQQTTLTVQKYTDVYKRPDKSSIFGDPPAGQNWDGAQTTIQLWDTDPLLNNQGVDRTLRTVFTHDHFGPSTHQQAGLYAGLLVEPENSTWQDPTTGQRLYDTQSCYNPKTGTYEDISGACRVGYRRTDGGPTSWQANIITANPEDSYREFALEFQDLQLAYGPASRTEPGIPNTALFSPNVDSDTIAALQTGKITPKLQQSFISAGIPLSSQATATAASTCGTLTGTNTQWVISDPSPPDADERYCVAQSASGSTITLNIFTPDIPPGWSDHDNAISPPPNPTIISSGLNGTYSLNYRNEPVPLRVTPREGSDSLPNATDLSFAFASIPRNDADLSCQPIPFNPIGTPCTLPSSTTATPGFKFPNPLIPPGDTAPQGLDPFTPLLRAYQGDKVQIRTLVGGFLVLHSFHIPALRWLYEPSSPNSGYRATQGMGISEHFEMLFRLPYATATPIPGTQTAATDYLYQADAGVDGVVNGLWGILRSFDLSKAPPGGYADLKPLPNNVKAPASPPQDVCPVPPTRPTIEIVATSAQASVNGGSVIYNTRDQKNLVDPNGLLYVRKADLDLSTCNDKDKVQGCKLKAGVPVEPLILRANAGECIEIELTNSLPASTLSYLASSLQSSPFTIKTGPVKDVNMAASTSAAIQPQLVSYDPNQPGGLGLNVGFNNPQTILIGERPRKVRWFAGHPDGTPVESGTIMLRPSDPLLQHFAGLVGAVVIEPKGASWEEDANTRAAATITNADGSKFRELVLVMQNDIQNFNLSQFSAGLNYRVEPFVSPYRYRSPAGLAAAQAAGPLTLMDASRTPSSLAPRFLQRQAPLRVQDAPADVPKRYANALVVGAGDPETPILLSAAGRPVRVRLVFAGGSAAFPGAFNIHGHQWQEEPWTQASTVLGDNPLSQVFGAEAVVPYQTSNFLLKSAGGAHMVSGDYLYELFQAANLGLWGLLRVQNVTVIINSTALNTNTQQAEIKGSVMVKPGVGIPPTVTVTGKSTSCTAQVAPATGSWSCSGAFANGTDVTATSPTGGSYKATVR